MPPLAEYDTQIRGHDLIKYPLKYIDEEKKYALNWNTVRKVPQIQAWYAFKGLKLPPKT